MSCKKCDEAQRDMQLPDKTGTIQPVPVLFTYVRVRAGNVLISGCKEHMAELIRQKRAGFGQLAKEKKG